MAVKQSINWLSQLRVDVPMIREIEDGVIYDFKTLWEIFQNDTPYILSGFTLINTPTAINAPAASLQVSVDGAIVTIPTDPNGSFLRVAPGTNPEQLNSANTKVTGSFTANSTNYIAVQFSKATDSSTDDLLSFWDVDAKVEFTRTVPTGIVLNYQFVINTTGFGTNAPIAIVQTNASNQILEITNCKQSLFRLGTGGATPNPNNTFVFNPALENPLTISGSSAADPFVGGDWDLTNFKQWMDAVMTVLKQLNGGAYWYTNGSTQATGISVFTDWQDSNDSLIDGAGVFVHSNVTPGQISWTSDLFVKSITGDLIYQIAPGSLNLLDQQVGYISLQRDIDFQPSNEFTFTNGSVTVQGLGTVLNISVGDWIKPKGGDISVWRKITDITGAVITLDKGYTGVTTFDQATKSIQNYTMAVADPVNVPASANTYWFFKRDDFAFNTATISSISRASGITTVVTAAPHNIPVGQTVEIAGVADTTYDGQFNVATVPTTTSFTYIQTGDADGSSSGGTVADTAKIYIRNFGALNQGESINIDDHVSSQTLQYIGSTSETDSTPIYSQYSTRPLTVVTDGQNLTQAIGKIDQTISTPVYDEEIYYPTGLAANTSITLPNNTRDSNNPQFFSPSAGFLQVYLNQLYKTQGGSADWIAIDNQHISFNYALPNDSRVHFRIATIGGNNSSGGGGGGGIATISNLGTGVGIAAGVSGTDAQFKSLVAGSNITLTPGANGVTINSTAGGGSLQNAYNGGNTIANVPGQPVTITASGSEKAAIFNGDIEVTGVIDPTGLQLTPVSSSPLASGQDGLYVDNSHDLHFVGNSIDTDITATLNALVAGSGQNYLSKTCVNTSGSTIPAGTPVYSPSPGNIAPATGSVANQSRVIGVTVNSIANSASGLVAYSGYIPAILSGFTHGAYLYLSQTPGVMTSTPPSTPTYPTGFNVVIVGVVDGNNLYFQPHFVGQL
jgi:hypothetical protein